MKSPPQIKKQSHMSNVYFMMLLRKRGRMMAERKPKTVGGESERRERREID